MLDAETKSRINTARDILVGKVPDPKSQVEQITIALIYKFMDDMDLEAEELGGKRTFFSGEYAKYSWRKIFDPRQGGHELINLYGEAIAKMDTNPGVPKLFRDIFKNAYLPYRDPETLKSFLKIINEFEYSHSEKLGDAFEFLLSILGSQGDAGQFRTPRHIIDFMVEIIDPKKHEIILDPACGTAGFLISSYKHIIKQNSSNYIPDEDHKVKNEGTQSVNEVIITINGYSGDKLTADDRRMLADNMHGYDISPDMVRLSLVNMYLHGIKEPQIFEYDSLTSEDHWNEFSDVILANPPFMSPKGGIRPHKRFSVQSNRSEVLFVDYIAEHLTPDGRAAVIVPEGIIFQSGKAYKQLRKMLVDKYLVGVISLPAGVFNPYSGVKTSILWLDKSLAKKTDKILFVKIENDGFDLGAQRRVVKGNDLPEASKVIELFRIMITDTNKSLKESEKVLIIDKSRLAENEEYNLSLDRYASKELLITNFNTIKLNDICEFNNGLWTGKRSPFLKVKVIRNTNFRKDGFIDWTDIAELEVEQKQFANRELIKGDIVLEKSGGGPTQPVGRVVLFDRDERGFSYSNFTSRIRVSSNDILPQFLWLILRDFYLRGKTDKYQKQTSGIRNLDFNLYKELQIPLPPLSVQEKILSEIESYQKIIDGARQVVENYKPRIDIDPEWEMVELGDVFSKVNKNVLPVEMDVKEINYIGLENISQGSGELEGEILVNPNSIKSTKTVFQVGDILYGKLRPNLNKVYFSDITGICSTDIFVLRGNEDVNSKLYSYYFLSQGFNHEVLKSLKGAQLPRVGYEDFSKIIIPLPPKEIQQQIVEQLDQEQNIVRSNKLLIILFEKRIKDRIAKVWGE
jgi:type I restriction enzyme M protein